MKKIWNILCYFFLFLFNVFILLYFHSYLNFVLMIIMMIFPIYSIYGLNKLKDTIKFEMEIPRNTLEKNQEMYFRFILKNETFFPLLSASLKLKIENSFYQYFGEHDLVLPIRIKKDTEVFYPMVFEYCGRIQVSAESIELKDLLGIYTVKIALDQQTECLVVPSGIQQGEKAGEIYQNGISESIESKEKGYDFSEVSGIREYIPGDKLQNIHWKLSAKKEELMVKERVNLSTLRLAVLVDLANDEEMRLESILELFDGVTKSYTMQKLPFTVYFYSSKFKTLQSCYVKNEKERKQMIETILYDYCYTERNKVEQFFVQENPMIVPYLYIGYLSMGERTKNIIFGDQEIAAILRE